MEFRNWCLDIVVEVVAIRGRGKMTLRDLATMENGDVLDFWLEGGESVEILWA